MKKPTTLLTIILSLVLPFMGIHAQVITTTPALPTASDSVILVFNATLGGGGMAGYTGDVYTHTGITIGNNQWQYVIGQWGDNNTQPKLTRIGTDLYELKIKPSIREFYNAPENANITQMCFVFRGSAREFYYEAHRRTDLIRFGQFTDGSYTWAWKGGVMEGAQTSNYRNVYPIPAEEIAANPYLKQNPSY